MKTLIMILILWCFISPAFSQKKKSKSKKEKENPTWFSVSLGGGYGNSVFLNNNTMNDKNIDLSLFNPSYSIIGKVNANFNFGLGVALEFGTSGYSQNYKIISNINGDNKYFPTFIHLDDNNSVNSTAGPLFMYIVYGKSRFVEIVSKLDQAFSYADENYSVAHYTGDKPTNVLSFQIRVEFCYHIGYFQRAKCDGHVEFLFF
ncbi:MAG: hypothetical protein HY738_02320 [Bacteroidia bacterium]|nr:hypothetical protein [Bacteroidia bacterium]